MDLDSTPAPDFGFAEGMEVVIADGSARRHHGIITAILAGVETVYAVLVACRGGFREYLLPEQQILARLTPGYDF